MWRSGPKCLGRLEALTFFGEIASTMASAGPIDVTSDCETIISDEESTPVKKGVEDVVGVPAVTPAQHQGEKSDQSCALCEMHDVVL